MTPSTPSVRTLPGRRDTEPRPSRRRRVVIAVLVTLGLLVAAGAWVAWRGMQVADALESAVPVIGELRADLERGEVEAATARLPMLSDAARTAHAATADPVWRAAEHLPWVGRQLTAVSDVTDAFDLLALDVVPALTEAGAGIGPESLRPVDGRIDLAPLLAAAPHLERASAAAGEAQEILDAIAIDPLVGPLAERVVEVQRTVADATATLDAASTVATLVPPMLGADGPRDYLVLVLNTAELRGGGGLVGAVANVRADQGALSLTDHRASRDLPSFETPVLPLTVDEEEVHTARLGRFMQNVTMTPDFPRAAELATEFWRRATGDTADGVIAMDATTLSYLLGATGPVQAPGGVQLDAATAVRLLLHESYLTYPDPDATDTYFAGAAAAVFDALATGQGDQQGLIPAVQRAVSERRLALWASRPAEQEHLGGTVLSGGFLSGAADAAAGVFLDDATGSKIDYFLDVAVSAERPGCGTAGDDGTVVVRVDLTSTVPTDLAGLPAYVIGTGEAVPAGTARTNLTVYAPVDGEVVTVRQGSAVVGGRAAAQGGREVVVLTSTLAPGEQESFELEIRPSVGRTVSEVWTTPTAQTGGRTVVPTCA